MVFAVRTAAVQLQPYGTRRQIARVPSGTAAVQQYSCWYVWYVTSTAVRTYAVVGQVYEALCRLDAHMHVPEERNSNKVRVGVDLSYIAL